jgi:hypothetical protein
LRDGVDDKAQVDKWTAAGGRAFAREARLRDEGKEAVVLTFPGPLAKEATNALRASGFRFSKIMRHWEGLALYEAASQLAAEHGGIARQVGGDIPGEAAGDTSAAAAIDAEPSARAAE